MAAPATKTSGFAGRVGEVWSESVASTPAAGSVIGDPGEAGAVGVFFEETEELAWFASHLARRADRFSSGSPLLPALVCAAMALTVATALAAAAGDTVRRMAMVSAATPCLALPGYRTVGSYPSVAGTSRAAARSDVALHRALVVDQRRFALSTQSAKPGGVGLYQTSFDPRLSSASTAVVSALIPVRKLYPSGKDDQTWISLTIDPRSGSAVSIGELFASPQLALVRLINGWKAALHGTWLWREIARQPARYTPTLGHYRYFALTPTGLAFGFPRDAAGPRFAAVIPYRLVRHYLSALGERLVSGVRPPRFAGGQIQNQLAWPTLQAPPPDVARSWPVSCT